MIYKYKMTSCYTSICIESNINLDTCFNRFPSFIDFPELVIKAVKNMDYCDKYCVRYEESNIISLHYDNTIAILKCPFCKTENATLLAFVGYPLLEAKRRQYNSLTFHGAGICLNDQGIVILGKEGAGKTTLAMNICQHYDAKLIGNDICVLDYANMAVPMLLGGTKFVHLRYESIHRNMPNQLSIFGHINKNEDTWLIKRKVFAMQLNVEVELSPVRVQHFFIVHIDQSKKLYHNDANTLSNILYLNENFSRYIRNTCTAMIIDGQLVGDIPSFDDMSVSMTRYQLINYMISNHMITYVSGNIDDVTNYILDSI